MTPGDADTPSCPTCAGHEFGTRQILLRTGLALLVKTVLLVSVLNAMWLELLEPDATSGRRSRIDADQSQQR